MSVYKNIEDQIKINQENQVPKVIFDKFVNKKGTKDIVEKIEEEIDESSFFTNLNKTTITSEITKINNQKELSGRKSSTVPSCNHEPGSDHNQLTEQKKES